MQVTVESYFDFEFCWYPETFRGVKNCKMSSVEVNFVDMDFVDLITLITFLLSKKMGKESSEEVIGT